MKGSRPITFEEIEKLRQVLDSRGKALVNVCLAFGLRISEALKLAFKDLSGEFIAIATSKGGNPASFPIPQWLREQIADLGAEYITEDVTENTPLFLSQKGGSLSREYCAQFLKRACQKAGIPGKVSFHSFRKSFITRVYKETAFDIVQTKRYSRHKNLSNLDYYIQTTEGTPLINTMKW